MTLQAGRCSSENYPSLNYSMLEIPPGATLAAHVAKQITGSEDAEGYTNDIDYDFIARNGRRRTSYTAGSPDTQIPLTRSPKRSPGSATTPTNSTYKSHSQDRYGDTPSSIPYYVDTKSANQPAGPNQEVANETAAALFKTPINTPGDALHLLLEASGRTESLQREDSINQRYQSLSSSSNAQSTESGRATRQAHSTAPQQRRENIDPAITGNNQSYDEVEKRGVADAIKAWSRLRFVRAGWFTAREAISYID